MIQRLEKNQTRKHILLDRPILGLFLIPVALAAFIALLSVPALLLIRATNANLLYEYASEIVIAFLILLLYRIWVRPYRGMLGIKHFWEGFAMLIPIAAIVLINLYQPMEDQKLTLQAVLMGTAPGITEEVVFRGIPLSNYMRCSISKRNIRRGVLFSGIVFGIMHAVNIVLGADLVATITQVMYAIGIGTLFGAVFIRTGTLLPCIIAHSLIDVTAFILVEMVESGGILTETSDGSILTVMIGIGYLLYGMWLLREEKMQETVQIWNELYYVQTQEIDEPIMTSHEENA